jgi:hypothetical protein
LLLRLLHNLCHPNHGGGECGLGVGEFIDIGLAAEHIRGQLCDIRFKSCDIRFQPAKIILDLSKIGLKLGLHLKDELYLSAVVWFRHQKPR